MCRVFRVTSDHNTYDDTVQILDRLDIHTEGGLKILADRISDLETALKQRGG
jgi:hypothetical protein